MSSIAVDVMGGDRGARECIPGAVRALVNDSALEFILVVDPPSSNPTRGYAGSLSSRVTMHPRLASSASPTSARGDCRRKDSLDAHRHRPREGGPCVGNGQRREYRRADGHGAFRAETVGPVERAPIMSSVPHTTAVHAHPRSGREFQGDACSSRNSRPWGRSWPAMFSASPLRASASSISARKTRRDTS